VSRAPTRSSRAGLDRLDRAMTVGNEGDAARIQQQLTGEGKYRSAKVGEAAFQGSGSIFGEPILVVNQKAKLIELNQQYGVFNANGQQIAAVNQVGQSKAKKVLRLVSNLDQFLTHKLEISDMAGQVLLRITRPAKVMKSTVIVSDGADNEIGRIVQENMIGKINFSLQSGGNTYGAIKARTGGRGTSASRTTPATRWRGSPRRSRASRRRCSRQPTTTSCRSSAAPAAAQLAGRRACLSVDTALKQDSRASAVAPLAGDTSSGAAALAQPRRRRR
jgi:hypothetical protein